MSSIDRRIVEMEFDNKQFEQGIAQSTSSLEGFNKTILNSAGDGALVVLGSSAQAVGQKFSAMGVIAATVLHNITNAAYNTATSLAKSLSVNQLTAGMTKYEQKTANIQTIMNATGESIEQVSEHLERLMWFSDETSFGFTDMTSALSAMVVAGGDVKDILPTIEGLANAVAFSGKGAPEYSRAIEAIKKSYSQGHMDLLSMKTLSGAGVMSKQLKQVMIDAGLAAGSIKKGQVTIENFDSTLHKKWATREVLESSLGKFAEFSSAVYQGVKDRRFKNAADGIAKIGDQYDPLIVKAFKAAQSAKTFTEAIEATKDAVSSGWMTTFELVFGNLEEATALWTGVTDLLWDIFASGSEKRNEMFAEWKDLGGRTGLIQAFLNIYNIIGHINYAIREAFVDTFGEMETSGLLAATKALENFGAKILAWGKISIDGSTRFERIGKVFRGLFEVLSIGKTVVKGIWGIFKDFLSGLGLGSFVDDGMTSLMSLTDKIVAFHEKVKLFFAGKPIDGKGIGESIRAIFKPVKDIADGTTAEDVKKTGSFLTTLIASVKEFLKGITGMDIAGAMFFVFGGLILFKVLKILGSFNKGITDIKSSIVGLIDKFSGNDGSGVVQGIVKIAGALALIAGAIALLGNIEPGRLVASMIAMGLLMVGLMAMVMMLRKIPFKELAKLAAQSVVLVVLGAAMNLFALALVQIGKLDPLQMVTGIVGLGLVLLQVIAFIKLTKGANVSAFKGVELIIVAVAMNMFARVIKTIGALSLGSVVKGVLGLTAVLFLVKTFIADTQKMNIDAFKGASIIIIAQAMNHFGLALKTIGNLPLWSIVKGVAGLGAVMAMVVVFIKATQEKSIANFKGATLIGIAVAINLFALSIVMIGSMPLGNVIKGVVGLGIVMELIKSFMRSASSGPLMGLKTGVILMGIAFSMNMFATAIAILGSLSIGALIKGVVGLGLVLWEVSAFVKVVQGLNISAFDGFALIGLAISMNLFGLAIKVIGSLPLWDILKGVVGLGLVMFELAVFLKILEGTKVGSFKAGALIALGIALNLFALSVATIGKLKVSQVVKGVVGLGLVMLGMVVFLKIFSKISIGKVGKAVIILGVLGLVMVGYALLFKFIKDINPEAMIGFSVSLSLSLLAMAAAMLVFGALPVSLMLAGIAKMALIGLVIVGLMAAFGGLEQALGMSSYIDSFGDLLNSVGKAIGKGISGIGEGLLSGLPAMGTSLGDFMTNGQPFFDGIAKLDAAQLDNARTLAGIILQIGMASVVSAIGRIITGAPAMQTFADDMKVLGEGLKSYAESTKGFKLSEDDTTAATNAAKGIADLANAIPPSGGIAQILTGTQELGNFVTEIPKLGLALKAYVESIDEITPAKEGKIKIAADTAKGIADLALALPPTGGIAQIINGTQDLKRFALEIPELGLGLKAYVDSIKDVKAANAGSIKNANDAAMGIAAVANAIPAIGGIKDVFSGVRDLVNFSNQMERLGPALNSYVDSIKNIKSSDSGKITAAHDAAMGIAELANAIPAIGGINDLFAGTRDLVKFSNDIPALGIALGKYADHIATPFKNLTVSASDGAISAAQGIAAVAEALPETGGVFKFFTGVKSLSGLSKDIEPFGKALGAYATHVASFEGISSGASKAATDAALSIAAIATSLPPVGGWNQLIEGVPRLASLSADIPAFGTALGGYAAAVKEFDSITSGQSKAATDAAISIAEVAKALPAVGGMGKFWTGVKSLSLFSADIEPFGAAMKGYITQLASFPELTSSQSSNAATAASSISEVAKAIPGAWGISQFLFGAKSLGAFSKHIEPFGNALVKYIEAIAKMTTFDEAKSALAALTAKGLVEVLEKLPKTGGLDNLIGGAQSLANFGDQLPKFGAGLKSYAESITGFGKVEQDDLDSALTTAKALNQFSTELAVTGNWLDWLTGTQDLGDFGNKAGQLGAGLKLFIEGIGGADVAKTETAISVMTMLKGFTSELATTGGVFNDIGEAFGGTQGATLIKTGENMASVGTNIGLFANGIKNVDISGTDVVEKLVKMFVDITAGLKKSGGAIEDIGNWFTGKQDLGAVGEKMGTFGMNFETFVLGIEQAAKGLESFTTVTGIIDAFNNLSKRVESGEIDTKAMTELGVIFGVTLTDELTASIQNGNEKVVDSAKTVTENAAAAITTQPFKDKFIEAGKSFSDGIAEGITANQSKAVNAAIALAKATLKGATGPDGLDMNSPPSEMIQAGKLFVTGFADKVKDTVKVAVKAVTGFANQSLDAFGKAMGGGNTPAPYIDPTTLPGFKGYTAGVVQDALGTVTDFKERIQTKAEKGLTGYIDKQLEDFMPVLTAGDGTTTSDSNKNNNKNNNNKNNKNNNKVITPAAVPVPINYLGTVGTQLTQTTQTGLLADRIEQLGKAVTSMKIVMDSGALVGQITSGIDKSLGMAASYAGRG